MLTIAGVSQKGGCGRSTLLCNLAGMHAGRALIIDLDPQGSALEWARRRGDRVPDVSPGHRANLETEVARAAADGYDLCLIDTPPHADQLALAAARLADVVLLPCRPATFDLVALSVSLDLCTLAKRPGIVVISAAPTRSKVVQEAGSAIRGMGGEIAPVIIHQRVAFQHSLIDGRTAAEYEPDGAAEHEVKSLLDFLLSRYREPVKSGKRASRIAA